MQSFIDITDDMEEDTGDLVSVVLFISYGPNFYRSD